MNPIMKKCKFLIYTLIWRVIKLINYLLSFKSPSNKVTLLNIESGEIRVVYLYRYISWFLTSAFYLIGLPKSAIYYKFGVILSLLMSAKLVNKLYLKFSYSIKVIKKLVLIEAIGITLLLLPTGGLDSPFIWYALNPALVAAGFLSSISCWLYLVTYISAATLVSYTFFNDYGDSIFHMIYNKSYLILVLILVTLIVQLLYWLAKQIYQQNLELEKQRQDLININFELQKSNGRLAESMEYIMSLYQVIENLNIRDIPDNLPQAFTKYASKLTKTPMSFLGTAPYNDKKSNIITTGEIFPDAERKIKDYFDMF